MDENEIRKTAKRELVFYWVMFGLFVVAQICFDIYAIKTFIDEENSQMIDCVLSILGTITTVIGTVKILMSGVIPYTNDMIFYRNHEVERMRAVIVKIKYYRISSCEVTARNLETGEEVVFDFADNNMGVDKIYDFIYLKNSKVFRYKPVSFEQLIEDRREKASKIDLN